MPIAMRSVRSSIPTLTPNKAPKTQQTSTTLHRPEKTSHVNWAKTQRLRFAEICLEFTCFAFLIVSSALVSGCGSLMGQQQYVSVDSAPRGAQVHDAKGRVVGKTPFFAPVSRKHQLSYYVYGADGERHWTQRDCRYAWLGSPLENFCICLLYTSDAADE